MERLSTVLASVFVPFKDTVPREFYFPPGKLVKQEQHDDTRNQDPQ